MTSWPENFARILPNWRYGLGEYCESVFKGKGVVKREKNNPLLNRTRDFWRSVQPHGRAEIPHARAPHFKSSTGAYARPCALSGKTLTDSEQSPTGVRKISTPVRRIHRGKCTPLRIPWTSEKNIKSSTRPCGTSPRAWTFTCSTHRGSRTPLCILGMKKTPLQSFARACGNYPRPCMVHKVAHRGESMPLCALGKICPTLQEFTRPCGNYPRACASRMVVHRGSRTPLCLLWLSSH